MALSSKPPFLNDNDPLYLYAEYTRKLEELLNGDWLDCTEIYPYKFQSGTPARVRREGMRWYLSWGFSTTNANGVAMAANSSYLVGKVPDDARPGAYKYFQIPGSGAKDSGMCVIRSSGEIEIRTGATVGGYFILDSVHWPSR